MTSRQPLLPPALLLSALLLIATVSGCSRMAPAPKPAPAVAPPAAATAVVAAGSASPTGDESATAQAASAENAAYLQRRRKDPPVIGGCEERCETPERAVNHLFDAFTTRDREALRRSFEWSILVVDGKAHGERWAGMWAQVREHEARKADIDRWLSQWTIWLDQLADPADLARSRVSGLTLKPLPGRTDVVEMTFRHPRLKQPRGENIWRFELTRRGWEWLISRIDHEPGRNPPTPPPVGSPSPGRL